MTGYNFNNYSNEYSLHNSVTAEFINLYGFTLKYIKTTKVNLDSIFGEIQNLRANDSDIFEVSVYPENTAGFDNQNDILSKFGILSFDSINLFISASVLEPIHNNQVQKAIGDLIVLPSGKVMEVTELEAQVPGVNNMFVYDNNKNVYMLKCKPYNYNHDEFNTTTSITTSVAETHDGNVYYRDGNTYLADGLVNPPSTTVTTTEETAVTGGFMDFGALFDLADREAEKVTQNTQSLVVKNLDPVFGDLG
jgi:hypothetical protein